MFHKEGLNIILSTFVITAILMITLDYLEVKNALPIKIFLIIGREFLDEVITIDNSINNLFKRMHIR